MCDPHEIELTDAERVERAKRDADVARDQGHDRLADTILRDAGLLP